MHSDLPFLDGVVLIGAAWTLVALPLFFALHLLMDSARLPDPVLRAAWIEETLGKIFPNGIDL